MSRFKLYAIFMSMLEALKSTGRTHDSAFKEVNKASGGILGGGSHMPTRMLNQRQKRKRARHVPQLRK